MFSFTDTAPTEIYPLSLHDALPIYADAHFMLGKVYINLGKLAEAVTEFETYLKLAPEGPNAKEAKTNFEALKSFRKRSEEHTSELQSRLHLVCRLLLEKKKQT